MIPEKQAEDPNVLKLSYPDGFYNIDRDITADCDGVWIDGYNLIPWEWILQQKARIDSLPAPTAQEVKETICPGCGKPSNHMEAGTTSDHWGVWHGECEKQFWMAGTGLDDRVPPFSKRNVEVKEEPC